MGKALLHAIIALSFLIHCTRLQAQESCQGKHGAFNGLELKDVGDASRSDSVDILHTRIALDLTQVGSNVIQAATTVRLVPRVSGIIQVVFDLLALTVDSVIQNGTPLSFSQTGEALNIELDGTFGPSDTLELTIFYQGDPVVDASGWGGFYTSGGVIYNLGVAFDSQPHSFGRAWHPCFDNFVERSSYEFIVLTDQNRHAWCTGVLVNETDLGAGRFESHWVLDKTIPSYLANVTSSTYVAARDTFLSVNGTLVPVDLVAQPNDTTGMKSSFANLQGAFDSHEFWSGEHRWPRVGYCLTPQGAMEHPTNISYPSSIANGSLTYEATMAHELAHHWWGDQITCARAEEMYINEGFAEYLSYLFLEHVYGRERYLDKIRENHHDMVWNSHLQDDGWWALADMPQDHTYGAITYNKGADVLHTLRSYLGDTLFRSGLTTFLEQHAFAPVTTQMLRDHLTATTGVDMTDFFADWILQPGWAAFEVDSFNVNTTPLPGGYYSTDVHVQQKLRGPAQAYHNVPMSVTFMDGPGNRWTHPLPVMLGPATTTVSSAPPFIPVQALLNVDDRISQAVTTHEDTLTGNGIYDMDLADFRLAVTSIPTPTPVRIEEYWVAADTYTDIPNLYKVSPDRWWRVHMNLPAGTQMTGRIRFDGRHSTAGGLDELLLQDTNGVLFHEDSVLLLYRPNPYFPWSIYNDFDVNTIGSATDKTGRLEMGHVEAGDYTLGLRYSSVGIDLSERQLTWILAPNPASGTAWLLADHRPNTGSVIRIHDMHGQLVRELPCTGKRTTLPIDSLANGCYVVGISSTNSAPQHVGRLNVVNDR